MRPSLPLILLQTKYVNVLSSMPENLKKHRLHHSGCLRKKEEKGNLQDLFIWTLKGIRLGPTLTGFLSLTIGNVLHIVHFQQIDLRQ